MGKRGGKDWRALSHTPTAMGFDGKSGFGGIGIGKAHPTKSISHHIAFKTRPEKEKLFYVYYSYDLAMAPYLCRRQCSYPLPLVLLLLLCLGLRFVFSEFIRFDGKCYIWLDWFYWRNIYWAEREKSYPKYNANFLLNLYFYVRHSHKFSFYFFFFLRASMIPNARPLSCWFSSNDEWIHNT